MITSYFEFSDGLSNKYWYIYADNITQTTVSGKLKKDGKVLTKHFATEKLCLTDSLKEIEAKLNKGFIEKVIPDWFFPPLNTDAAILEKKVVIKESILISIEKGIQPQDIRKFLRAIRQNDIDSVTQYLSAGLQPGQATDWGNGYEIALEYYHKEMIELLTPYIKGSAHNKLSYIKSVVSIHRHSEKIDNIIETLLKANYDFSNDEGLTTLLPYLKLNLVKQLLELVKVNVRNLNRQVIFDSLIQKNKPVVIHLIDNGISMNGLDPLSGLSIMHLAFYHFGDDLPLIKKLLAAGADPYIYSSGEIVRKGLIRGGGEHALDYAINQMSQNVIDYVQEGFANFDNNIPPKAVFMSAMLNFSPLLKRFLSKPMHNIYDEHGNSLIHYACCAEHESTAIENIIYMLKTGINANIINKVGRNALFYFCFSGSGVPWKLGDELNQLLEINNFFNAVLSKTSSMFWPQLRANYGIKEPTSQDEYLAKWFSGETGDRDFLALILQKVGLDIECTDIYGMTPIMYYARYSLENDLGSGAHPLLQLQTNEDTSALTEKSQYTELSSEDTRYYGLMSLLRCRPNVNQRYQDDGATILHHIQYHKIYDKEKILALIYHLGADVNALDNKGRTPIHYLILADNSVSLMDLELEDTLVHLISKGNANPNIPDKDGNTPLHFALQAKDKYRLAKTLLEYGANPFIANDLEETAEHLIEKLELQDSFAKLIAEYKRKQGHISSITLNWQPLVSSNIEPVSSVELYASLSFPQYSLDYLMITDDHLFITENTLDKTYCIDKITGKTIFSRYHISYPNYHLGHLYAGTQDRFSELDPLSGEVLWSVGIGQDMSGPIFILNEHAICLVGDKLVGLSLIQHKQLWKVNLYGQPTQKGYIVDNHLAILIEEANCTKVDLIDFSSGYTVDSVELHTSHHYIDSFKVADQLWVYTSDHTIQTLNLNTLKVEYIIPEFDDDECWQTFTIMGLCNGNNRTYGLFKLVFRDEHEKSIYRLCYLDGINAHTIVDLPIGGCIHYDKDAIIILDCYQKAVGVFHLGQQSWQIWQFPCFYGNDRVHRLFTVKDNYIFVSQCGGASYAEQDLLYVLRY